MRPTPVLREQIPGFSEAEAASMARELFGIMGQIDSLPSDRDQNFRIQVGLGESYALKIAHSAERRETLEAQNAALHHLARHDPGLDCPRVQKSVSGEEIAAVPGRAGQSHYVRLLSWVGGPTLAEIGPTRGPTLRDLGRFLAHLDKVLESFSHAGARRDLAWDLRHAGEVVRAHLAHVDGEDRRTLLEQLLGRCEDRVSSVARRCRTSIIHNDGNEHNIVVGSDAPGRVTVRGIVDFGDMVETHTVIEPAVAAAYAILDTPTLLTNAAEVAVGYHEVHPLTEDEASLLFDLIVLRLCVSVSIAGYQARFDPNDDYRVISQDAAWRTLQQVEALDPDAAREFMLSAVLTPGSDVGERLTGERILELRKRHTGPSLSLSYDEPLHIVRGQGAYLFDGEGNAYLDCVNNVCHVGHCHPRVVQAASAQMAVLNTNTRYLHENLVRYSERLAATFPEPLNVVYLVNSGSEANELALRLARTHTGGGDFVVVSGGYHGNTGALVSLSPYKYRGPGGGGRPDHVHEVPLPDVYRGEHRDVEEAGVLYAAHVAEAAEDAAGCAGGLAAFLCESLPSCGGQIVLPPGYLREAYTAVREAGGVCIADEVQVGFGRVGTHFWGFETQGVVPDIVTLGKPMGNGHPIGAVVTSQEIADSFADGMEYFSTFGGNPVSCAVGLAVLDVIEEEALQQRALEVGGALREAISDLKTRFPVIGDVRGLGLFLGVEFVRDPETREPAPELARRVVEAMKERRILLSTDGPDRNVIKIKPPLVFSHRDAEWLARTLGEVLA